MERYRYDVVIGTLACHWYGGDDRIARRKLGRILRLVWPRFRDRSPKGSMADATNNGWYEPPQVQLGRVPCDSAWIVRCVPHVMLESFPLEVESQREFLRVWDAPRFK